MYTTLFAASLLASSPAPAQETLDALVRAGVEDARVQTVVRATPSWLHARNATDSAQVFLFGTEDGRNVEPWIVPAGAELELALPTGSMIGMALEIVALEPFPHASGPISLTTYRDQGYAAAWVVSETQRASFWLTHPHDLRLVPLSTLVSPGLDAALHPWHSENLLPDVLSPSFLAPTHVPVITPGDKPSGDAPPVLEEKPLPPV